MQYSEINLLTALFLPPPQIGTQGLEVDQDQVRGRWPTLTDPQKTSE